MLIKKITTCLIVAALAVSAQAQTKFNLKEAVDFALKNNPNIQNAKIEETISGKKVNEIKAIGLPQVSASVNYTNYIQIPTQRLPNFINEALPPGSPRGPEFIDAQFGIPNSLGASVTLNQLLFDGTYFLGLKAAQEFVKISEYATRQTEIEVQLNVVKTYYSVLMADKRIEQVKLSLGSLDSTLYNMKALADQGFAESVDTARISLSMSNLKIQLARLEDQKKIMLNMLKILMGYDVNQPMELTESTESLEQNMKIVDVQGMGNVSSRPEYQILNQQLALGLLDKKRYRVGYYPTLNGFFTHQQNTYAGEGQINQLGNPWFPGTSWGLSLHVPIFSGLRQRSLIQQADLRVKQYELSRSQFEQSYQNEVLTAQTNYLRALENYELQKKNVVLSEEIKRIAKIKLQEGLGTSLEYTTAETENNTSQSNLVIALYELMMAELDYRKATGTKIID